MKVEVNETSTKVNSSNGAEAEKAKKPNPFASVKLQNTGVTLVDEDALLGTDNNYEKFEKEGDCSTKPKACANCSCGRAEQE